MGLHSLHQHHELLYQLIAMQLLQAIIHFLLLKQHIQMNLSAPEWVKLKPWSRFITTCEGLKQRMNCWNMGFKGMRPWYLCNIIRLSTSLNWSVAAVILCKQIQTKTSTRMTGWLNQTARMTEKMTWMTLTFNILVILHAEVFFSLFKLSIKII